MNDAKGNQSTGANKKTEKVPYETPAIIYEGLITTRASNSPGPRSPSDAGQADPSEVFSSD